MLLYLYNCIKGKDRLMKATGLMQGRKKLCNYYGQGLWNDWWVEMSM